MTQEEKQLVTKTLCEGMLYGIKVNISASTEYNNYIPSINDAIIVGLELRNERCNFKEFYWDKAIVNVRPYLRPMSSMTEEEEVEWFESVVPTMDCDKQLDFYCKYHFDYRGLIEKGLALEAPKGMYDTKTE